MVHLNASSKRQQLYFLAATVLVLIGGNSVAFSKDGGFGAHSAMGRPGFLEHKTGDGARPAHDQIETERGSIFRTREGSPQENYRSGEKTINRNSKGSAPWAPANGSARNDSKNTIHPIVTNTRNASRGSPPESSNRNVQSEAKGSAVSAPAPGAAGVDKIRPIVTKDPAPPASIAPTAAGKLPPNDPVGNTHPTPGPNSPTVVSVSNGVTTTQIQNGPGGVVVYSDKPGTITVDNGKEKTTLPGGSVTLSGDVVGVGHGAGVEVGPRNGEGKTTVAIKPSEPAPAPAAPTHVTGGPEGGFFGALGGSIKDGVKAVGNGIEDGAATVGKGIADGLGVDTTFKAGPEKNSPPAATSTIQQQ